MTYVIRSGQAGEGYTPYGKVREAFLCQDREVVLAGPADTGKTLGLLNRLHVLACKWPNASIVIMRLRLKDIHRSTWVTFEKEVLEGGAPVDIYGGQAPKWVDYTNGSRIWLSGLLTSSSNKDQAASQVLGQQHDVIYANQAEELSLAQWEMLRSRCTGRAKHMPYGQLIGDCNPAHPNHWIRKRARTPLNPNGPLTFIESTHRDNPDLYDPTTGEITAGGVARLGALDELSGVRRKRLFEGLWAAPEGAIYETFISGLSEYGSRQTHVVKAFDIPKAWPRFVGIDPFGEEVAGLWIAFDPNTGILNVYQEYGEPFGLTTEGHAQNMLAMMDGPVFGWVCGQPAEEGWRNEFRAAGIPCVEPPIADVWLGIDRVLEMVRQYRIVVHDNCVGAISQITDYRRKLGSDGVPTDKIENKERYHLLDALRYVIAWLLHPAETSEVVDRRVQIAMY